jgi:hypothetical protein
MARGMLHIAKLGPFVGIFEWRQGGKTMSIGVLFADDQIPYNDQKQDAAVREEICKEFEMHRKKDRDATAAGFDDDYNFFNNLLRFLISDKGVRVRKVRSLGEAKRLIESYNVEQIDDEEKKIDAAIIDLSWWGDKDLPSGYEGRHNRGYELLESAQSKFKNDGVFIPCIAYSQNFYDDPAIRGRVLKLGALPIPKLNRKEDDEYKRQMGYEALLSAIEHLKELQPINIKQGMMLRFEKNLSRKKKNLEYCLLGVFAVIVLALVLPILASPTAESNITTIVQALLGAGGTSLLGRAWKDQNASSKEFSKLAKEIGLAKA